MDSANKKQTVNSPEMALASEVFDQFCNATTLKSILGYYRQLCELLKVRPNVINQFYPKLKAKLRSWKAQALWKKFDQRANHKCYNRGKACPNTRVLIIGGGPCGLRTAIEAQLLGAKVVVIEKRDRMSRNNVLHLWPFVIQDLRGLGAKKFFGKFCAGSIDHISIRQLQCILLKVALILGVEFHESVSFDSLIQPPDNQEDGKIGWRAKTLPVDHPVSQYEFDVLIGADGKRNTLEGFKRKEFRGKLAIAITANFINKRTEAEARVEEISGVAFIFNQKFFKELYQETGIDLENIVYYKDDTHYFVMTAKKHSLIDKGVILQDHADTAKLLAKENVDREALMLYAREAAEFSTEYQMMNMEFAVNHYGKPDVAMFDFTSMYAAENASRVLNRHGHGLLMILVGDSLLEPFWPTGSGCARGFLSSLDAGWAIKGWGASFSPLEVIAERESIYRLLGQTTPENLNRDYAAYTLDPHTRYPNLNVHSVLPIQVRSLLDTDDPESIKQSAVQPEIDAPKKRRRRDLRVETQIHPDTLLRWLQKQVALYDKVHIEDMGTSFKDGLAICAIIHRYRPDLINFYSLNTEDVVKNNQVAFDILEKELNIPPIMTGEEMAQCDVPDTLTMFSYLTQIYEAFKGDIPYIKHPKLEPEIEECSTHPKQLKQLTPEEKSTKRHSRSRYSNENVQSYVDKKDNTTSRRSRKRRSTEKMSATMDERQKRLDEIEKHRIERMKRRQYLRKMATQQFYKSMQMLQANAKHEKDGPFEDYSIFLYRQTAPDFKDRVKDLEQKILYPDRQPKIHIGYERGNVDEEFSGKIKDFEDKLKGTTSSEKKPRDLLRAIGKIEKTDWNVKEIEKKIEENKMGRGIRHDRVERVPKWSREQFLARQIKMEKRGNDQRDTYSKYADIDNTLKNIGKKIREGSALGHNKVSAMAEQFSNKNQDTEPKLQKSNTKSTIVLPVQGSSEMCHFCNKRVYLMERLSAEGKFFHRGCFRCEYCSTSLRIGNHTFDREKNGGRFYCTQHFGLSGTMKTRAEKKRINLVNKENVPNAGITLKTPEKAKIPLEGIVGLDLLDRGQTPERIEFENLAEMSDPEEAHSQMDEDEWTDRNFGVSTAEMGSSDDISDMSDSDEDDEIFEEAIDQPLTTEGTLELAKNWTLRYSHPYTTIGQSDTGSNEYEDSSDEYTSEDDESGTATEDEEDIRARELRKQEVWLKVPPRSSDTDTGSETEVKDFQDSIDSTVAQESLISSKSKVIAPLESNMNVNANESLSDRSNLEESLKSSNEVALTSNELALSIHNQDVMTSADKSGTSLNVAPQTSKSVIHVTNSLSSILADADDSISNSNRSLICSTNIPDNNYLDRENCSSEYESFVDENIQPDLNSSDKKIDSNSLQNDVVNLNPVDLSINVNDSNSNDLIKNSFDFPINNLEKDFAQNEEAGLEQVARITLVDAVPCTEVSKDPKVSDNETILNVDDSSIIASCSNKNNNSASSNCPDHLVEYLKSDLFEETGVHEDICVINQREANNSTDKNKNIIVDDKNIHMNDIPDKEINVNEVEKSVYPTLTVTSPSPTLEIQLEDLPLETSKLLVPLESHNIPSCDNAFDKLKRDLQQRKAKNKAIGSELRPLSIESARLKVSKYFTESKKVTSKRQSTRKEATEDTSEVEMVKLDIKPRLSGRINTEEMLKYFDKTNFSSSCDKCKVSNATGVAIEPNKGQKLEIDIEDVNKIDQQFNQIEAQNDILFTDVENNQSDFTNIEKTEKNNSINNILKNDVNNLQEEKEVNVNLSSLIDNDTINKDNVINSDPESNILNNEANEERKENSIYLDKIVLDDDNKKIANKIDILDKDKDLNNEITDMEDNGMDSQSRLPAFDLVELQSHLNDIEIDYVDPLTSDVPKLEDYNTEASYLDIDLESVLLIDVENNQSDIPNIEKTEKNNSINNILKNDTNGIHKEEEDNLNLSSSLINNDTINDILLTDVENNHSDFTNIEKTEKNNSINNILKNDTNGIHKEEEDNLNLSSSLTINDILLTDVENNQSDITNIEKAEKNNSINNILKNDINGIHKEEEDNLNLSSSLINNDTINDILLTDVENNQSDFTNIEKTERNNSINNILKNNVNNLQEEKEVNINLSSLIDNDTINKDNVIKIDPESNILNNEANEGRKENSIYLDKIVLDDDNKKIANKIDLLDKDKDKDLNKKLFDEDKNKDLNKKLFENNTLSIVSLLNNNTNKAMKHNMMHKSDTNLNESTPQFFHKNVKTNSKSLPALKDTIYEDVKFAAKVAIDKVVNAPAVETKIANDNSIQNCIREIPNRLEQNLCIGNFSQNDATATPNLFAIAELSPPEIPVRKKSVKRNSKSLYQSQIMPEIPARKRSAKKNLKSFSQDVEDILKLQDPTINNTSKLCENSKFSQNDKVSNIEKITEDLNFSEIKAKAIKDVTLPSQSVSNISEMNEDISIIQNHDFKSVQKPLRLNVKKLQNEDITNFSNLHNEIKKDSANTTAENRNIADMKLQNQSKNISSNFQKTHSTNRSPNKSEEFTKSVSHSNSKKDKCVIS